jgi:hypothetical protein
MTNVVYMEMLYYPCNNKSLADAAGMKIVINDFGVEGSSGECLVQRKDTVCAQLWLFG